jgi:AcrR family transcriptional regulator
VETARPTAAGNVRLPAAERRRQLLDQALEVFAARGFHATSMSDVAEAAGVTKPVLYQHFASKRDLYLELLDDVGGQLQSSILEATGAAEGPRQQVEAGFAAYFRHVSTHRSAFTLLFGSGARLDGEFTEAVQRVEVAIAAAVAALIDADIGDLHRRILAFRGHRPGREHEPALDRRGPRPRPRPPRPPGRRAGVGRPPRRRPALTRDVGPP